MTAILTVPKAIEQIGNIGELLAEAHRVFHDLLLDEFDPELRALSVEIRDALFSGESLARQATYRTRGRLTPLEYLQRLAGWAASAIERSIDLFCDHSVGICECAEIGLVEGLQSWADGKCDLGKWGWVTMNDEDTGKKIGVLL